MRMARLFCSGDWLLAWKMINGEPVTCWRRVDRRERVTNQGVTMLRIHFSDWLSPSSLLTTDDSLYHHSSNSYKPFPN